MATSNQDTNIKDVAAPASATTTNIGHVLGLNAAKTQDVLIPLSMLRTVIAAELKTALAAITSGSPDVPVLDGNNLKYMTLANFAKVVGEQSSAITSGDLDNYKTTGEYTISSASIAQAVSNTPVNIGGRLIVKQFVGSTSVLQIYIAYAATPSIYLRRYNSSAWDSWILLQRAS